MLDGECVNGGILQLEVFTQRNSIADFIQMKLNFIPKNRFLSHPLRDLEFTYALHP